jgi:hypothetical protein
MKRVLLAIGLAATAAVTAQAREPYEGIWAAEAAWCKNKPFESDDTPIVIRRRRLEGLENRCTFVSIAKRGEVWRVRAVCRGEGMTERRRFAFQRRGAQLVIRWDGDADGILYTRCD